MSVLLYVENICKSYGAVNILHDATVSISSGQKIGVIGRNGAGKSTLCRIITGQEEMDSGKIHRNSELRLSYLEQHDTFGPDETVTQFLMRTTNKEEWECGEIAGSFQLKNEILDTKVSALPGGFRTRVKLAAMLLQDPNFLLLDEPTNFLDLSTLILLENFLQDFDGGFLIVSHDREFLKRTCDHTLEVEHAEVNLYPGDIEEYFEFKEEQLDQKIAYNKTVEKKKAQLQLFVDRFKAKASMATRAKSKMKQIAKLTGIEVKHPLSTVKIKIPPVESKTGIALQCQDLSIGYQDRVIASGITMDIDRGSKIAILGDNGQGKTTFLRTLAEDLTSKAGTYRWGTGLKIAYYAQHVFSTLHPRDDIYSHLQRMAVDGVTGQDVLDMAGAFLFKGEEVKKKIPVLSGGERARLILAGLLLTRSQVLLFDEPTNHLDFETVEALAQALKTFAGTIFFISHDRTFVNLIASGILEVKQGRIKKYPGTYEDYVYHLEAQARAGMDEYHHLHAQHTAEHAHDKKSEQSSAFEKEEADKKAELERRAKIQDEIKKMKTKADKLESRIKHLTHEKELLMEEINNNPFNFSKDRNEKLRVTTVALQNSEEEWLSLLDKLDKLNKTS
ncbi:MAG: ATP-binding cassette domain-containing protein [Candidatus Omnitrophica bacterium]|nr:ATP-binding cassette domain-containing protein [Candidatus Omnitrophota bacterium]